MGMGVVGPLGPAMSLPWGLVLGSSVQFSLSSKFGKTKTKTGLLMLKDLKRLDWTDIDQSSAVFSVVRPVLTGYSLNQSSTGHGLVQ